MSVNGFQDLLVRGFEVLGNAKLRNHLGGLRAQNMGAKQFAILRIEDQLYQALSFTDRTSRAPGTEWKLADLQFIAFFPCLSSLLY